MPHPIDTFGDRIARVAVTLVRIVLLVTAGACWQVAEHEPRLAPAAVIWAFVAGGIGVMMEFCRERK